MQAYHYVPRGSVSQQHPAPVVPPRRRPSPPGSLSAASQPIVNISLPTSDPYAVKFPTIQLTASTPIASPASKHLDQDNLRTRTLYTSTSPITNSSGANPPLVSPPLPPSSPFAIDDSAAETVEQRFTALKSERARAIIQREQAVSKLGRAERQINLLESNLASTQFNLTQAEEELQTAQEALRQVQLFWKNAEDEKDMLVKELASMKKKEAAVMKRLNNGGLQRSSGSYSSSISSRTNSSNYLTSTAPTSSPEEGSSYGSITPPPRPTRKIPLFPHQVQEMKRNSRISASSRPSPHRSGSSSERVPGLSHSISSLSSSSEGSGSEKEEWADVSVRRESNSSGSSAGAGPNMRLQRVHRLKSTSSSIRTRPEGFISYDDLQRDLKRLGLQAARNDGRF